jgi:hypothetical protein
MGGQQSERDAMESMTDRTDWKAHYVVHGDADEIERHLNIHTFSSGGRPFELLSYVKKTDMPNALISPGSGGHTYVFAELGYEMHRRGYNVFIMPKHGGDTISTLMKRHRDAPRVTASWRWRRNACMKLKEAFTGCFRIPARRRMSSASGSIRPCSSAGGENREQQPATALGP